MNYGLLRGILEENINNIVIRIKKKKPNVSNSK